MNKYKECIVGMLRGKIEDLENRSTRVHESSKFAINMAILELKEVLSFALSVRGEKDE